MTTYAMTCMYSANFPRNLVRVTGFLRTMICVIPSTVSAGREMPRLLETGEGERKLLVPDPCLNLNVYFVSFEWQYLSVKAALIYIVLDSDICWLFDVKGVAHSDKPKENDHATEPLLTLSSTEHFSIS